MSLLEMICKELGVEVGEPWIGKDERKYMITEYGQVKVWNDKNEVWIGSRYNLGHIVNGELKSEWKPKQGDIYYVPHLNSNGYLECDMYIWKEDDIDKWFLKNNLVFKTEDKANELVELNPDIMKLAISRDQLINLVLDAPHIEGDYLIEIEDKGDTYEIVCYKDGNKEALALDDVFEMINNKMRGGQDEFIGDDM